MKRRKSLSIFIFVLIAFIVLGVGYAAINNINLIINGTGSVTATQSNFDVRFLDIDGHRPSINPGSPNTVSVIDNTTATFDVSTLSKKGDTATATIDVKNNSNGVGARIGLNSTNSNDTYFKVTEHIADTELQAGDITTVTVTIEMLKTPVSNTETTSISATLTASPIDNSTAVGNDPGSYPVEQQTRITYLIRQVDGEITPGDVIGIGETEDFYVISSDAEKTVLLAKYNLLVGYESDDYAINTWIPISTSTAGYGLQSVDAVSYNWDTSEWKGMDSFSNSNFWNDGNGLISPYDANGASYSGSPYPDVYSNNSNIYQYISGENGYVNRLIEMGAPSTITGRLLRYEEAYAAQNIQYDNHSIIFDGIQSYWLGSAYSSNYVWNVSGVDSSFCMYDYDFADIGVRPVIEIPTIELN